jgi:hypothetical protein
LIGAFSCKIAFCCRRVAVGRRDELANWRTATQPEEPVAALCLAATEMSNGLIDADMGGGVRKKRVAMPGRGKSRSARTLLATNRARRWFFVFGFEKNERANVTGK